MNLLQFWEWGLWPWLGDVIASQPFLTLMVPVATLTGVVITTKSNERIRRRELQEEGERWRYEVVKDSAAVQRQAVLTFLKDVITLELEMDKKVQTELPGAKVNAFADRMKVEDVSDHDLVNAKMNVVRWFLGKALRRVLTLELSISDPTVLAKVSAVRNALEKDQSLYFMPEGQPEGVLPNPYVGRLLAETYPVSLAVEKALDDLKKTAIKRLHPPPPEVPVE